MKKITLNEIRRTVRDVIRENEEQLSGGGKLRIKKLEDGLTMQDLEEKYPWVFEADIENAIIGKNEKGIIWYSGIWRDGTWHYGSWKRGTFAGKKWLSGSFYGGTFAGQIWENGAFWGGIFDGETWEGGDFYGGTFAGGTFAGGIWQHEGQLKYGGNTTIWENGKWIKGKISYRDKNHETIYKEIFVNPNEYFKGDDEAEYNIEQHGSYFIVVYKNYKGEENERAFKTREAAENFAKNL